MKRVAIFRSDLLRVSETFIRDQSRALKTWEPILVGFREIEGGLPVSGVRRELVPVGNRVLSALRFWFNTANPHLVQRLQQLDVSLVHAHFSTGATEIWPSVKAAGLPLLVTLHGSDINIYREWWEAGHGGLRKRIYPRRLLRMAYDPNVHFIAVSEAIKRRAIEYGIPAEKVTVAYIGVDIGRFKLGGLPLTQRRKRILFVGRMVEKKSPTLMVRIFAEVRKEVRDAELVMIGDGPLLAETKQLASKLATPVLFLGAQSSDEVLAQMHEARVFCLPSVPAANGDAEGFGMVVLEAQACGVPVVSSARGGADEGLLDGETGYACREGATEELVTALKTLLRDDETAARFSLKASHFTSVAFDIRSCSEKMEILYETLPVRKDRK